MKKEDAILHELSYLTLLSKEGKINDEQFNRLESLLQTDEVTRRWYIKLINNDLYLRDSDIMNCFGNSQPLRLGGLHELAEYERIAPAIETPQGKPGDELIQKVVYPPKEKRRITKFNIFMLFNAAAVILFLLSLRFVPSRGGIEVATLTDSLSAKWAEGSFPIKTGTRMTTGNERLLLREGYAELLFDNQTRVTLEGPAEFQISAADRICLNYGKVYLAVSKEAIGFSVYTPNTKIIDMGTEFGVKTATDGSTELHVLKGKINLLAGITTKVAMEVIQGKAKNVSGSTSQVHDIPVNETEFVRSIDSKHDMIWRGQRQIHLADIVGGGNGLGTGKQSMALTLKDTMIASNMPVHLLKYDKSATIQIRSNPFIDSLFIPKGKTHVCSKEEIVAEFPDTSGSTFGCVTNRGIAAEPGEGWDNTILLGGKEYGTPGAGMIHIHSNLGVTFDLNQIRQSIPGLKIVGFSSLCGITETAQQMPGYNSAVHSWVDFWVLVDGVIQFKKEHVSLTSGPIPIDIKLNANDRYLSLAVTDSDGSVYFDWAIFAQPKLEISPE
jgi:hypothetical protein